MTSNTITLQLEGQQIPAQVLSHRLRNFLDILQDVARNVSEELNSPNLAAAPVSWIVDSIRSDSPITLTVRAEPAKTAGLDVSERTVEAIATGLAVIQEETTALDLPRYFSLEVLSDIHKLSRRGRDGISGVTVRTADRSITLSDQADLNMHKFLVPAYVSYGLVEGILEMVSAAGDMPRFSVRNRLADRAIRCMVPYARLSDVLDVFNRRVAVSGRIRTNERGDVLSITMEDLTAIPKDSALPSIREVAGAFDLTMGRSIEDHLESLRHAP